MTNNIIREDKDNMILTVRKNYQTEDQPTPGPTLTLLRGNFDEEGTDLKEEDVVPFLLSNLPIHECPKPIPLFILFASVGANIARNTRRGTATRILHSPKDAELLGKCDKLEDFNLEVNESVPQGKIIALYEGSLTCDGIGIRSGDKVILQSNYKEYGYTIEIGTLDVELDK